MTVEALPGLDDGRMAADAHRRLLATTIGSPDADLTFTQRLAHEQGWTMAYAKRAVQEYLRFAYLCTHAGPCTPSVEVDQVWHLHMTYTRHYWGPFAALLGQPLHHGPTLGGATEDARYEEQYEGTLARYSEVFGFEAPADLWPASKDRFTSFPHLRWVDLRRHSLTSKRRLMWAGLGLFSIGLLAGLFLGGFP